MRKNVLLSLALLFVGSIAFAQDRTVSGKVSSTEDGSAVPGVNIVVKGTTTGAVTDIDGNYKLTVPADGGILVFSFIGLETQEISIGNRSVIDVSMASDAEQLSEVVVTALGITREKRSLGYSVQELDGDQVAAVKDANVVNSLAGKVAGVQVTGANGTVGGSSRIIIRGINSIDGNNQPLFVVDGTPIDNSNFNSTGTQDGGGGIDYGNATADINPEDIASISVLKGASAAALYGSRAANGVILITTKTGSSRKGLGIDFTTGVMTNNAMFLPDYQNEYGGGYVQTFDVDPATGEPVVNYAADESWGPRMDGQLVRQWYSWYPDDEDYGKMTPFVPHSNNIRDFYETGITTNNSVAVSGGNDIAQIRLSYTNFRQSGIIPNTQLARNTLALNANTKLTDKLTVTASGNYVDTDNSGMPGQGYGTDAGNVVTSFNQWFQRQIDMDKLRNYKTADGRDRTWNIKGPTDLDPLYWENPYWVLNESPASMKRNRLFGNVAVKYEIIEGLTVKAWARTDQYTDRRTEQIASFSIPQDKYSESLRQVRENNYEFLAQYNTNLSETISLAINLGANSRQQQYYRNTMTTVGGLSVPNFFNVEASIDRPNIDDYSERKTVNSVYGSASFGWNGMVFVDASLRNDWSSTLPSDNNSYLYPAITGSFVFSEVINSSFLTLGKIRASWSQVGNDTQPYRTGINYSSAVNYGSQPAFAVPNQLNNPNLKPEQITSTELGFEVSVLQDRIGLDFTYYTIEAADQIISLDVPQTSGFATTVVNAGLLTNKGFEVMLRGTPVKSNDGFNWDIMINWARNRNEVVELAAGLDNYQIAEWGPSINARVGQPYGSWNTDGFEYVEEGPNKGQRIVGSNGIYNRLVNQTYGTYLPNWTGGILNRFSYKGVNLSVMIDGQQGGQLYSVTNRYGDYSGLLTSSVGNNAKGNPVRDDVANGGGVIAEGVVDNGDGTYSPNTTYIDVQTYLQGLRIRREYYLYDASFIKLREMKIGYNFPKKFFGSSPFRGLEIAFVGRNLAILHKNAPNIDPENAYGSGNIQGFENGQHPSTRSLGFSLNVKL